MDTPTAVHPAFLAVRLASGFAASRKLVDGPFRVEITLRFVGAIRIDGHHRRVFDGRGEFSAGLCLDERPVAPNNPDADELDHWE